MDIDILGIDLAKRVFQLHGADRSGSAKYGANQFRHHSKKLRKTRDRSASAPDHNKLPACGK